MHQALDRQARAIRSTLSTRCLLILLAAPTLAFQHYHPVLLRSHLPMSSYHSASKSTSHRIPLHPVSPWRRDGYTRRGGVSMGLLSPMLSKVGIVSFWSHVDALHAVTRAVGFFVSLTASVFWQAGGAVLVAGGHMAQATETIAVSPGANAILNSKALWSFRCCHHACVNAVCIEDLADTSSHTCVRTGTTKCGC